MALHSLAGQDGVGISGLGTCMEKYPGFRMPLGVKVQ